MAKVQKISIALPKEMIADIRYAVDSGQYATTSEVIREAVREWRGKERPYPPGYPIVRNREDLLRIVKEGIAAADRGDVKPAEHVFARLETKYKTMAASQKHRKRAR